jgi:dienelactone hydrolase
MLNPLFRRTVSRLARGIDIAFSSATLARSRRFRHVSGEDGALDHDLRIRRLQVIASFYARPQFAAVEGEFFPRPALIAPDFVRVREFGMRGEVVDLRWPSLFEPMWSKQAVQQHLDELPAQERKALGMDGFGSLDALVFDRSGELRDKYLRARANRTAYARWFRHKGAPRPVVVLIHGYMAGNFAIEERMWQVKRLFQSGLDVVLTVLPLHGPRRSEARGYRPPAFPSGDPRFTIEGFRQVVFDHRAIFDYLHSVGVRDIGLMGMSLGGYTAALLSTLEAQLRFSVLFVPLGAIEDLAHRNGHLAGDTQQQLKQRELLRRAEIMINPLARPSLIPSDRVIVVAGEADRVTGVQHARLLAEHFGAELSLFHGGHLLQLGRERAFEPVWRLLGTFAAYGLS